MGAPRRDADCWEPTGRVMLGFHVPYKRHAGLPKLNDRDQLFPALLRSSSGKARGTALCVHEPGGLAVSFCPRYCGYCIFFPL